MAEEPGGLGGIGNLIPSLYYDLIARVCAGVPFLGVLLWDYRGKFGSVTWSKLTLLLGAGYVLGLILTPLSAPWDLVQLLVRKVLKTPFDWKEGASGGDEVDKKDKAAGATIAKMQAEAVLCQNLFTAFLVLVIINTEHKLTLIACCTIFCRSLILLVLALCAFQRTIAYLAREKRLHRIYAKINSGSHQA
jgi:hypothetical protein